MFGIGWYGGSLVSSVAAVRLAVHDALGVAVVVVAIGLVMHDVVATELNAGYTTLLLWFVLAGYASWLFVTQHLSARLHRRKLRSVSTEFDRENADEESEEGIPSFGCLR